MTPERVRQIEELYHATREDRAVLDQADLDLRREVESLLDQDSSQSGMLDQPACVGAAGLTNFEVTATVITPGDSLEVLTNFRRGRPSARRMLRRSRHRDRFQRQHLFYTTEPYRGQRIQKFVYKGIGSVSKADQGVV